MRATRIAAYLVVGLGWGCQGLTDAKAPFTGQPVPPASLLTAAPIGGYKAIKGGFAYAAIPGDDGFFNYVYSAGVCLFDSGDLIYDDDVQYYHGPREQTRAYGKFSTPTPDTLLFSSVVVGRAWFNGDTIRMVSGSHYLFVRDSAYAWNTCGIFNK